MQPLTSHASALNRPVTIGPMPTHSESSEFINAHGRLSPENKLLFHAALFDFIGVLQQAERDRLGYFPVFPKRLGVTRMVGRHGIWEFAWSGDGRCTWELCDQEREGLFHIHWRRIGGHEIYNDP
jgi:hypothetical protein